MLSSRVLRDKEVEAMLIFRGFLFCSLDAAVSIEIK